MIFISALFSALINFAMCILHIFLFFGAPLGEYVLGGTNKVIPKKIRILNVLFSILWFLIGMMYLQKGNIFQFTNSSLLINSLFLIASIFFLVAIPFNGFITKSKKEKYTMTPLCILITICNIILFFN